MIAPAAPGSCLAFVAPRACRPNGAPCSGFAEMKQSHLTVRVSRIAFIGAAMAVLMFADGSGVSLAADAAPPASSPVAGAPPAPKASASPLYDVIVDLGRNEATRQEVHATLRTTAEWNALAGTLQDPTLAADLRVMEGERDTYTRARYMELVDADTRIRERMQSVNDATAALGRFAQKVESDLDRLEREVARWPDRVELLRQRQAPEELQRRVERAGPELEALRDRLRTRRDELLVAYGRGVETQARLDAVRAAIAERRERLSVDLRRVEDAPVWEQRTVAFPHEEVRALVRLARLEFSEYMTQHGGQACAAARAARGIAVLRIAPPRDWRGAWRCRRIPCHGARGCGVGRAAADGRAGAARTIGLLPADRLRDAAAGRPGRVEDVRGAYPGHRMDAGARCVRQRISCGRRDESRLGSAAARAAGAAFRGGVDPRLAPWCAGAVHAALAPVPVAAAGPGGVAGTGGDRRRGRPRLPRIGARPCRACGLGTRIRVGVRDGRVGDEPCARRTALDAARAKPAQRARAWQRGAGGVARGRRALLRCRRHRRLHARALGARRPAAPRPVRHQRERDGR